MGNSFSTDAALFTDIDTYSSICFPNNKSFGFVTNKGLPKAQLKTQSFEPNDRFSTLRLREATSIENVQYSTNVSTEEPGFEEKLSPLSFDKHYFNGSLPLKDRPSEEVTVSSPINQPNIHFGSKNRMKCSRRRKASRKNRSRPTATKPGRTSPLIITC